MIADTFLKLKSNLELTDTFSQTISRQHNAVRSVIENSGQTIKDTKLIGSLHPYRQTRIQPLQGSSFDIDILVILGEFDRWASPGQGTTSQMAMEHVHSIVRGSDRYNAMTPQQDHPTVTFDYANNVKVELVPAYIDNIGHTPSGTAHLPKGRGYWIPKSDGGWELADYDYDAEYISAVNKLNDGLLVPVVKMLKALKRRHFPLMKSFHLEVIAAHVIPERVALYKKQNIPITFPALVAEFLHNLEPYLTTQVGLPGSNSLPFQVDAITNMQIVQALPKLKELSKNAIQTGTDSEKHLLWRAVFGDLLPLS